MTSPIYNTHLGRQFHGLFPWQATPVLSDAASSSTPTYDGWEPPSIDGQDARIGSPRAGDGTAVTRRDGTIPSAGAWWRRGAFDRL